jgi:localization factor PodJL
VGAGKPGRNAAQNFLTSTLFTWLSPRTKSLVLVISMAVLVFGAVRFALDFSYAPAPWEQVQSAARTDDSAPRGGEWDRPEPPPDQSPTSQGANGALPTSHIPYNANALPDEAAPGQVPGRAVSSDMAASAAVRIPATAQTAVTASPSYPSSHAVESRTGAASAPMREALSQGTAGRDLESPYASAPASDLTAMPLPPTIGSKTLLAAASAGDPSACYEIAMRFAQGRNTTQDLAMAAAWLERAARSGLAPAQFRLGSMYEKGLGVRKDVAEAHRLYVAAADKGHAKAMHNLAVLYAAGLDGKPDYASASHWFRRAAAYGIVDSQYNLAILYARGAGIERNLVESYKWFALAAKGGDKDAAHKRDEVALRLDPRQLESAKLNAESFAAVPQPDEATAIKVPPGGWDQAVAAATTKSRALVTPARFPGR